MLFTNAITVKQSNGINLLLAIIKKGRKPPFWHISLKLAAVIYLLFYCFIIYCFIIYIIIINYCM